MDSKDGAHKQLCGGEEEDVSLAYDALMVYKAF